MGFECKLGVRTSRERNCIDRIIYKFNEKVMRLWRGEARRPRQGTRPRLKEKLPEYYYTAS